MAPLVAKFQAKGEGVVRFYRIPDRHVARLFCSSPEPPEWKLRRNNFNSPRELENLLK